MNKLHPLFLKDLSSYQKFSKVRTVLLHPDKKKERKLA